MRKEPFFVGDFVHVYNRGNRKQEIVRDEKDKQYFVQALYYFNDSHSIPNIFQTLKEQFRSDLNGLNWPSSFPERDPLVKIHAFILKDNHFHLILEEIKENGITEFMRKVGIGMTCRFNKRYDETGRLFQGSYRAKRISEDNYLQYLDVYVHIKNALEMYPGGIGVALKDFDRAYDFALQYPWSSLRAYETGEKNNPVAKIISTDWFSTAFEKGAFKEFARSCMEFVDFDEKTMSVTSAEV